MKNLEMFLTAYSICLERYACKEKKTHDIGWNDNSTVLPLLQQLFLVLLDGQLATNPRISGCTCRIIQSVLQNVSLY